MKTTRSRKSPFSKLAAPALVLGGTIALFGAQGCLTRPVVPILPGSGGVIATKIRVTRIDKVDLLLMVDNSQSMGDKQSELGRRIPLLVKELTNPDLVGGKPKYKAVADLHVGVISSSLGSYGTSACDETANAHNNDHGHLLKRPADALPANGYVQPADTGDPSSAPCPGGIADASAITWTDGTKTPPGQFVGAAGSAQAQTAASCLVESVKEDGCGYENQLESVYHFLIDPDPWQTAKVDCTFGPTGDACGTNKIAVTGRDDELLKERAAFLRKDSLLAVMIITDENDASLKPAQLNWIPWAYAKGQMQRGWKACETVPDDFEPDTGQDYATLHDTYHCKSCFEDASDPNCSVGWSADPTKGDVDGRNTREFHQVQRFGYNFYWGRQRYVDGFTKNLVPGLDAKGALVGKTNPIFDGGFRDPSLVIVAGILGVPLDLVSNTDGSPKVLQSADWDKIASGDLTKRDPRMIESITPRAGRPTYLGGGNVSADPPGAPKFGNGGERVVTDGDDLQYACIAQRAATDLQADCQDPATIDKNPLCNPGTKTQPYFKAYPSLRPLRVLRDVGASGFVASLCNNTYAPAIQGIIERLQAALNSQCFKTILNVDPTNNSVNCLIEESLDPDSNPSLGKCEDLGPGYCTPGTAPCRVAGSSYPPVDAATAAGQLNLPITAIDSKGTASTQHCPAYQQGGNVYVGGADDPQAATDNCGVKKHLVCEMRQINDNAACLNDPNFVDNLPDKDPGSGWCYSKVPAVVGDACLKIGAPGAIRFAGSVKPKNGSEVFTLCQNNSAPAASSSP